MRRRSSGRKSGAHAWHCVGVRSLLCRRHGGELAISIHHTHRFLNRDYLMSVCGGLALSEAGFPTRSAIVTTARSVLAQSTQSGALTALRPHLAGLMAALRR